jgi:hypothetical protein
MNQLTDINIQLPSGEKAPVVYLIGDATPQLLAQSYTKYRAKQLELEALGFTVLNKCNVINSGTSTNGADRVGLGLMLTADFVSLLDVDWRESEIAHLERSLALKLHIPSIDN